MALVEIKDFSALTDNRHFWSFSKKKTKKRMKNLLKYNKNYDYEKEIY